MSLRIRAIIVAGVFSLSGCGDPDKLWEDGNYRVYKRPKSREIILGYHFGDGGVVGLSDPTVTAAGADARYVVFCVDSDAYFYIVREEGGEGVTLGPFEKREFEVINRQKDLPEFDWHLD